MDEATDLPEELDRIAPRDYLGTSLSQVFGNAELVGVHTHKGLIAAWYGGTGFNVYDPGQWFEADARDHFGATQTGKKATAESGEVYHFNMPDHSQLDDPEQYARETLEEYGFQVVG